MSQPGNEGAVVRKKRKVPEPPGQGGEKQQVRSGGLRGSDLIGLVNCSKELGFQSKCSGGFKQQGKFYDLR